MTAILVAALVAAALGFAFLRRWKLSIAVSVRGAPDGSWALAGGAAIAGVAATYTRARDVPASLGLRVLGLRVLPGRRAASRPRLGRRAGAEARPEGAPPSARKRLAAWVDPLDLAIFLVDERRRVAIGDLEATVRLGLEDLALAGQISGVLSVLSALAAPFGRLRHQIDWSGQEALEATASASVRFSPALVLWDVARFAARSIAQERRRRAGVKASRSASQDV